MFNKFKKIIVNTFPILGKYIYVNRGLDVKKELEEADNRDDFMGQEQPRFNWQVINPEGDWTEEAQTIKTELQNDMDCTGHAMKNCLEMLLLRKFGIKMDISASYINYMAGTDKWRGNSMTNILKAVYDYGWVTDVEWPEANRWIKPPQSVIDKGIRRITKEFIFGYDRIQPTIKGLDEGAKYSPPYTGGSAWLEKNGVYITFGKANHCFSTILHLVEQTIYNRAKDSFKPTIKHLADNFVFLTPRRIYLEKKNVVYDQKDINKLTARGFRYIQRTEKLNGGKGEVYELTNNGLVELSLQKKMEIGIAGLADKDDLTGISEKDYYELIK